MIQLHALFAVVACGSEWSVPSPNNSALRKEFFNTHLLRSWWERELGAVVQTKNADLALGNGTPCAGSSRPKADYKLAKDQKYAVKEETINKEITTNGK